SWRCPCRWRCRGCERRGEQLIILVAVAAMGEEQIKGEQPEGKPWGRHSCLPGLAGRNARPTGPFGNAIPRNSAAHPTLDDRVHFFFNCSSKNAKVCSRVCTSFSPRQPWASPSRITTLALTPAAWSLSARIFDCRGLTVVSAEPWKNRN